ncbi:hypothetical protein J6590_072658 [Homalodisca vitripennis]|nr:hypothetical protein J6590_072658 [Homalodisca vitripennis]
MTIVGDSQAWHLAGIMSAVVDDDTYVSGTCNLAWASSTPSTYCIQYIVLERLSPCNSWDMRVRQSTGLAEPWQTQTQRALRQLRDMVVSGNFCSLSTESILTIWKIASCLVRKPTLNRRTLSPRDAVISSQQQGVSSAGASNLQGLSRYAHVSRFPAVTKPVTDVSPCRCL